MAVAMIGGWRRAFVALVPSFVPLGLRAIPPPGPVGESLLGLPCLCPWRSITGIACPGCGMLRSLVCLAHGDWNRSMAFHPLGPVVFAGLLGWAVLRLWRWRHPDWAPTARQQTAFHRSCWLVIATGGVLWPARLLGWLPPAP